MRRRKKKWPELWRKKQEKRDLRDGASLAERDQVVIPDTITATADITMIDRVPEKEAAATIESEADEIGLTGTNLRNALDPLRPAMTEIDMIVVGKSEHDKPSE